LNKSEDTREIFYLIHFFFTHGLTYRSTNILIFYIDAYIAAAIRTPLGGFNGSLASLAATKLGSIAIEGKKSID
jgi:hypothetical protein